MAGFWSNVFGGGGKRSTKKGILTSVLAGPGTNYLVNRYGAHKSRQKRRAKKAEGKEKRAYGRQKKDYKEQVALQKAGIKRYNKQEGFQKEKRLTKDQRGLMKALQEQATTKGHPLGIEGQPTFQAGQNALMDLLSQSPEAYNRYSAPHIRQFQEDIIPALQARYQQTGFAPSSPSFQGGALREAGNLAEKLAAHKAEMLQGALGRGLEYATAPVQERQNLSNLVLGTEAYNNVYNAPYVPGAAQAPQPQQFQPRQPSMLNSFLQGAAPAVGAGIGTAIGGPIGGVIGGGIGGGAGSVLQAQQQQPAPMQRYAPQQQYAMPQRQQLPSYGQRPFFT